MDRRIVTELVKLADSLDKRGLKKEADQIDGMLMAYGSDVKKAESYLKEVISMLQHIYEQLNQLGTADGNPPAARNIRKMLNDAKDFAARQLTYAIGEL